MSPDHEPAIEQLATEAVNPASADIDLRGPLEIAQIMNAADQTVAAAVGGSSEQGVGWTIELEPSERAAAAEAGAA